jgi:pimeloyl-ACP methyl ester carboxylesterase
MTGWAWVAAAAMLVARPVGAAPASPRKEAVVVTFTSKDGTQIAAWKSGTGPALVVVHGTAADHNRWAPVLPALEANHTVYAIDRRGRGQSGDAAVYAFVRECEDIEAVVDGIGGPVDLLAHSHGAYVSAEAALLCRNLRKLILYEPPIPNGIEIYTPGIAQRLQALLDAGDREGLTETFFRDVAKVSPANLAMMKTLPSWTGRVASAHTIVREITAQQAHAFPDGAFENFRVPTLLLQGGASPPFFGAAIRRLQTALPHARLVVLPGQMHVAQDTAPALFVREVEAFLVE